MQFDILETILVQDKLCDIFLNLVLIVEVVTYVMNEYMQSHAYVTRAHRLCRNVSSTKTLHSSLEGYITLNS